LGAGYSGHLSTFAQLWRLVRRWPPTAFPKMPRTVSLWRHLALRSWLKLHYRRDAEAKRYPIRGVCESHSFWQAVVTNSCFYPDAVIDIHAPVNASTGQLNRLAADILISETKALSQRQLRRSTRFRLPEESSSGHNRVVVNSLTDLVFGCRGYVLSLQVDPLRQLVAGEADPGRVVFDEATCPCRCVWRHW
jgi:hypothetical protein